MVNYDTRRRRARNVAMRAALPFRPDDRCVVFGCGSLTRKAASKGLDGRLCRRHADYHSRHGSPYKGSYGAGIINRYRDAVLAWLEANSTDVWVVDAIGRVQGLYARSGPFVEAYRLRGLSPRERATKLWARLRRCEIDPKVVVASALAVELVISNDYQAVRTTEYRKVQVAKVVHRLASGSHRKWNTEGGLVELHKYPQSRGQVLRFVGADLVLATELLVDARLSTVNAAIATAAVKSLSRRVARRRSCEKELA